MIVNSVINKDCIAGIKEMPDSVVDLVVTDPPYYIENLKEDLKQQSLRQSNKNSIFCADWDSAFDTLDKYKDFMKEYLLGIQRIMKDKAQCYMFFSYHHMDWIITMIKDLDFRYYKPLVWYKSDTMGVFPNQYGCNYENILWFRKKGDEGEVKLNIGCRQRDVFSYKSTKNSYRKECGYHPTPKPIGLIRQLIVNGSNPGDLVFDGFMGSGTTAVACQHTNRKYYGFESNPDYCKIIDKRLAQGTLGAFTDCDLKLSGGNIS